MSLLLNDARRKDVKEEKAKEKRKRARKQSRKSIRTEICSNTCKGKAFRKTVLEFLLWYSPTLYYVSRSSDYLLMLRLKLFRVNWAKLDGSLFGRPEFSKIS